MLVPFYLIMAYRYYVKDDPIATDSLFDKTAKELLKCWDSVEHYHKHLLSRDMLEAGTYIGEYPSIVKDSSYTVSKRGFSKNLEKALKAPTARKGSLEKFM